MVVDPVVQMSAMPLHQIRLSTGPILTEQTGMWSFRVVEHVADLNLMFGYRVCIRWAFAGLFILMAVLVALSIARPIEFWTKCDRVFGYFFSCLKKRRLTGTTLLECCFRAWLSE